MVVHGLGHFPAVHAGHGQVADHRVHFQLFEDVDPLLTGESRIGGLAEYTEPLLKDTDDRLVVIGEQHPEAALGGLSGQGFAFFRGSLIQGSLTVNVVPRGFMRLTPMVPPC